MGVSVSSHRQGSVLTVVVGGEVDLATCPEVDDEIRQAIDTEGVESVQVDLSEVTFLDSSGIALLLRGRRRAEERGVAYQVTGAHGITQEVLEITGVWAHLSGTTGNRQPTVS